MPLLCSTGRCFIRAAREEEPAPLAWSEGPPWEFWLECRVSGSDYLVEGFLRRGEEKRPLSAPTLVTAEGLIFFPGEAAVFDDGGAFPWAAALRRAEVLRVPIRDREQLIGELFAFPRRLRVALPEDLRVEETPFDPRPRLHVLPSTKGWGGFGASCRLTMASGSCLEASRVGESSRHRRAAFS